jgi:transcriptional regulator with XRE-family HTH domain
MMEVYEQINLLIKEKNLTKREFAKRLIALEPKSKRTGEIISEKAIYAYLSGASVINANLIPYIADVLQVSEQSLFIDDTKTRNRLLKYLLQSLSTEERKTIEKFYIEKIALKQHANIISLLSYASEPILKKIEKILLNMKSISEKI